MKCKRNRSDPSPRWPLTRINSTKETGFKYHSPESASKSSCMNLRVQYDSSRSTPKRSFSDVSWYQKISKSKPRKNAPLSSITASSEKTATSVARPTSWLFFSADSQNASESTQPSLDFDIHVRSHKRQLEKQQVFSMLPSSALSSTSRAPELDGNGKESILKQIQLVKKQLRKRRYLKTDSDLTDVSRTPGPIDGSLYAKVNKKKTPSTSSSLPSLPEYEACSLPDQHFAPSNSSNNSLNGFEVQDSNKCNSSVPAKEGVIKVNIKEGNIKLLVPPDGQQVDLLADVSQDSHESTTNPFPARYQPIEDFNVPDRIQDETEHRIYDSENSAVAVLTSVSQSPSSLPRQNFSDLSQLPQNLLFTQTQSMRNVSDDNKDDLFATAAVTKKRDSKSFIVTPEIERLKAKLARSKSSSLPCIAKDEMTARRKSHLSKVQIHEAMSLINECLSDQKTRSDFFPPLSAYETNCFSYPPVKSTPLSTKENLPQSIDHTFSNEIFQPAAHICTAEPDVLDDVIAELTGQRVLIGDAENVTDARPFELKGLPAAGVLDSNPDQEESHQHAASYSDVDSGIDGSALTGSVSSDVKLKPTSLDPATTFLEPDAEPGDIPEYSESNVDPGRAEASKEEPQFSEESVEEKRVRDEIISMQKRLEELQEKQIILQKRKQRNRHSFDVTDVHSTEIEAEKEPSNSNLCFATLPKSPARVRKPNKFVEAVSSNSAKVFSKSNMMTTAYSIERTGTQFSPFGKTSPGYNTPDPIVAERANVFTPAYAHPMHQPQRMSAPQYCRQKLVEEKEREKQKRNKQEDYKRNKEIAVLSPKNAETKTSTSKSEGQENGPSSSDELQSQLDELDLFIAELTQNAEPSDNTSTKQNLQRSYSYNSNGNKSNNKDYFSTAPKSQSVNASNSSRPPKPPSRSRSSYDSVNRRQCANDVEAKIAEAAKLQEPCGRGLQAASKDDDVFALQGYSLPSYPPQTCHTRPYQQQVIAGTPTNSKTSPKKMMDMEERLSPQLFIALSLNPGGRPVEEIHSYKEDLDPGKDVVDSASPTTPGFPVSPSTPYVNDRSPISGQFPVGFVKTPLSALGLKHNPRSYPVTDETNSNQPNSISQQNGHLNEPMTNSPKENFKAGSPNGRLDQFTPPQQGNGVQETISRSTGTKHTLLTNHSHDSGYADSHAQASPNGWISSTSAANNSQIPPRGELQAQQQSVDQPGPAFAYQQTSSRVSSNGSQSLSGSSDSLLSDGSSSGQSQNGYLRQRSSQPALPPKESRNSRSSVRTTSTGSGNVPSVPHQISPTFSNSPIATPQAQLYSYTPQQPVQRQESRSSNYEKHVISRYQNQSSDDGLGSPTSARTSSSSLAEMERLAHDLSQAATPKFIKDTTSFWYKPNITREQALAMLRHRPAGCFVVRDSRCYPGAFGLALKVNQVPVGVRAAAKPGADKSDELVRHFLIEPSTRGVKLKGSDDEPVFGSLSALIYQHSITPIALPCKLVIPVQNQEVPSENGSVQSTAQVSNTASELLKQGAACNVLYLGSVNTELLTGPDAVERSVRECIESFEKRTVVHFKVSPQGITLTDNARKLFFRRHYPTATINFCGMDPCQREPQNRRWNATADRGPPDAKMFGFVAKKSGSSIDNMCHVFAELDRDQPAQAIVNFVSKILLRLP